MLKTSSYEQSRRTGEKWGRDGGRYFACEPLILIALLQVLHLQLSLAQNELLLPQNIHHITHS